MTAAGNPYELYAIRYASIERQSRDNFLRPDRCAGSTSMDYYVWAARNTDRTVVIDTGFAPEDAAPRGRTPLRPVAEGLAAIGIDPAEVSDVVITHLHNDHAGNTALFPHATFHLQQRELAFATGPAMRHPMLGGAYDPEDIADVLGLVRDNRVRFYDGDATVAPGLSVHLFGGHTAGSQAVQVATACGPVVLASDLVHFYKNLVDRNLFPVLLNSWAVLDAYEAMTSLVDGSDGLVPGHDPLVLTRYRPASPDLTDWIVRLDEPRTALPADQSATTRPTRETT